MFHLFCGSPEGIFGLFIVLLVFGTPVSIMVIIANIILKDTEFYKKHVYNTLRKGLYFTALSIISLLICVILTIGL
ncbi:hypothetical protein [Tenacibaculum sp. 190524A05c]|uniref:Uncharacterized protein n=1 Tax=Tenacibaculum platacis TaxID=3137852 RepID=A0ABP1ERD3_9FLAO